MKLHATALYRAATVTIWLIAGLTIASELSEPFKTLLASFTGHHWTAKSLIAVVAFFILYGIFRKSKESKNLVADTLLLCLSVVLAGLVIFGFFSWHFLNA